MLQRHLSSIAVIVTNFETDVLLYSFPTMAHYSVQRHLLLTIVTNFKIIVLFLSLLQRTGLSIGYIGN